MPVMSVNSLAGLNCPADIFITFIHCSEGEIFSIYN